MNERQLHLQKVEAELKWTVEKLDKVLLGTVEALAVATEMRDPYTAGHARRVAHLACSIAEEMRFRDECVDGIWVASLLHDIGKVAAPSEILSKPGTLTEIELSLIKTHPKIGHEILKGIDFPWPVADAVLQHHERLNGTGYPLGLSDKDIILEAKVIAVADVVEAMSSHRPYRAALGIDKALEEITANKSVLYDGDMVDACVRLFRDEGFKFN